MAAVIGININEVIQWSSQRGLNKDLAIGDSGKDVCGASIFLVAFRCADRDDEEKIVGRHDARQSACDRESRVCWIQCAVDTAVARATRSDGGDREIIFFICAILVRDWFLIYEKK